MYKRTDCNDYICVKDKGTCREAQPGESGVQVRKLPTGLVAWLRRWLTASAASS